jgi:hypothetical protein
MYELFVVALSLTTATIAARPGRCNRTGFTHSIGEVAMATEAALMADQKSKLIRREEVAEGTILIVSFAAGKKP